MHYQWYESPLLWILEAMKSAAKFAVLLIGFVIACFVFLTWAMQTVWIASFPGGDTPSAALHFYLQLGASVVFAIAAACVVWKWYRSTKSKKNSQIK